MLLLAEEEIFWSVNDWEHVARVSTRLLVAAVLGAAIGFQRGIEGKEAGPRTHMLVALGSALFIIICKEARMASGDLSRVVQGIVTGIGFLGAGQILKLSEEHQIRGLTTAASIWVTCGIGVAVGFGALWPALVGIVLAMVILTTVWYVERWLHLKRESGAPQPAPGHGESPDAHHRSQEED
jgi:putative Mg2+ transporter-C (MgtC) family protein